MPEVKITPAIRGRLQEIKDGRLVATSGTPGIDQHYSVKRIASLKVVPPTGPLIRKMERAGLMVWVSNPEAHEHFYAYPFLAQLTPAGEAALHVHGKFHGQG